MNIILNPTVLYLNNIFRFSICSDFLLNIYYNLHLYYMYIIINIIYILSYVYYHYHTRNVAVKNMEVFLKKFNSLIN